MDIGRTFSKCFQELPPENRLDTTQSYIVELLHVSIHHSRAGQAAEVASAVRNRFIENPIGLIGVRLSAIWNLNARVLSSLADMPPVVVAIFRSKFCRLDKWFKENRRPTDDVSQNPRNHDDQILFSTGGSGGLKPQTGFGFFGQQIPAFELNTQQNFAA